MLFPNETKNSAPTAAASLCMNSLSQFYAKIVDGSLPIAEVRGKALCMRQMPWIFGTARIANPEVSEGGGSIDGTKNFVERSKHIAVLCRGLIYKIKVLNDDFSIAATTQVWCL